MTYIVAPRKTHIHLVDRDNVLIWDLDPAGVYNPKAGHIAINARIFNRDIKWWW